MASPRDPTPVPTGSTLKTTASRQAVTASAMASMTPDLPPPESATINSISPARRNSSGSPSMATPRSTGATTEADSGARYGSSPTTSGENGLRSIARTYAPARASWSPSISRPLRRSRRRVMSRL
jgi:hypothetical protein